ncbi:MAG: response regulator [Nitrospiraceae bacterium]|nr:response regulator [Nitrospiraceae bacterium]
MRVLLIEDNEDDAILIREMLAEKKDLGIELEWVDRLSRGLTELGSGKIDLVLLDLSLPDSHGLETFDTVQHCAPDVPIVVLTGLDDEAMANQAVRRGAQDYLVKGRLDSYLLTRAARYAVERKQAERALRESEAQLRQSQKMEGIGQLAGGIAHDFNNLLTVINSYSDMLLGEIGFDNPFVRNGLDQIKEAGHRAASLTRQLLAFTRQQVLEPKILDLNESVSNMAKLLRRLIGEDIALVLCPHPALGRVKVDPGQVEQIIMNLAVNARDAMPGGGELTIETMNVELDNVDARQQISVAPGSYVMLGVSDTGCGMDADTKTRMFEPFFTTKGPGKGTGLGLATVHGIVKQSGGSIGVSSDLGKGTTFNIYLPRIDGAVERLDPISVPNAAFRGSETILLVEDEEMVRALAQAILERNGYTVLAAKNVHEALWVAQKESTAIHLLLTDTIMPGMNGPELAQQVLAIRPAMKVLYMSGYTDKAFTSTAACEPGFTFLQKPFTPQTLGHKVREILAVPLPNRTERAA